MGVDVVNACKWLVAREMSFFQDSGVAAGVELGRGVCGDCETVETLGDDKLQRRLGTANVE